MTKSADRFKPKEEFTKRSFDPNIRHRMDEITNDLIHRGLNQTLPQSSPQSCYAAVQHKGQTWHLFNAARMPLGRMAEICAIYMRGKHKPTYDQTKANLGDVCVIVNAANLLVTGRKME